MMRLITVLVVACVVVNAAAQPETRPIHLVITGGQSNNSGTCSNNVPVIYRSTPDNVRYCESWDNGVVETQWGPLAPRVEPNGQSKWGMEYTLAHALAARGGEWAIIKVSKGGSRLAGDGAISWNVHTGQLFQTLVEFVSLRRGELEAQGFTVVSVDFCWLQMEADATNYPNAIAYQSRLTEFLLSIRAAIGVGHVTISEGCPVAPQFDQMPIVWSAVENIAAQLPDVTIISQCGLPLKPLPDGRHLTKDGYLQLGAMLAASIP